MLFVRVLAIALFMTILGLVDRVAQAERLLFEGGGWAQQATLDGRYVAMTGGLLDSSDGSFVPAPMGFGWSSISQSGNTVLWDGRRGVAISRDLGSTFEIVTLPDAVFEQVQKFPRTRGTVNGDGSTAMLFAQGVIDGDNPVSLGIFRLEIESGVLAQLPLDSASTVAVSYDGSLVLFGTTAALVSEDTNQTSDLYLFRGDTTPQLITNHNGAAGTPHLSDQIRIAGISADNKFAVVLTADLRFDDPAVFRVDLGTGELQLISATVSAERGLDHVSSSGDARTIAYIGIDQQVVVWRDNMAAVIWSSSLDRDHLAAAQVSSNGRYVVFKNRDPGLVIYDTRTKKAESIEEHCFPHHRDIALSNQTLFVTRPVPGQECGLFPAMEALTRRTFAIDLPSLFSVEQQPTIQLRLEEPVANTVHSGIGNLRGWAVTTEGSVGQIEWALDGVTKGIVPYGGGRGDVASAFPDIANAGDSGFSMAINYGDLSPGPHSITATAIDDQGRRRSATTTFFALRFDDRVFIPDTASVRTDAVTVSGTEGQQVTLSDVEIDGKLYRLTLRWRTATQGFEIVSIREM